MRVSSIKILLILELNIRIVPHALEVVGVLCKMERVNIPSSWWGLWLAVISGFKPSVAVRGTRREFLQGLLPCSIHVIIYIWVTFHLSYIPKSGNIWEMGFVCMFVIWGEGDCFSLVCFSCWASQNRKVVYCWGFFGGRWTARLKRSRLPGSDPGPGSAGAKPNCWAVREFPRKAFKDLVHFPSFLESQRPESCC